MARYQRTILMLTSSFIALTFSHIGWAYPTPVDFRGNLMRWEIDLSAPNITYQVNTNLPGMQPYLELMVADAARLWNDVEESYANLVPSGSATPMVSISFESNFDGNNASAGYAQFDKVTIDGPVHCQIKISLPEPQITSMLRKTTLHELGHCLGLGHSLIPEAIMSYDLDQNRFALDVDDQAALSRLYPKDGSDPTLPMGCSITRGLGGLGGAGEQRESHTAIILLLTFPLLLLRFGSSNERQDSL